MTLVFLFVTVRESVSSNGRGEMWSALYHAEAWFFDKCFGVETRKKFKDCGLGPDDNVYEPCALHHAVVAGAFARVAHREKCVMDVGAGKGKLALVLWFFGFKNIVCVEKSAYLCDVMQKNFERHGVRAKILNCDATLTPLEPAEVIFMFFPFKGQKLSNFFCKAHRAGIESIIFINLRGVPKAASVKFQRRQRFLGVSFLTVGF